MALGACGSRVPFGGLPHVSLEWEFDSCLDCRGRECLGWGALFSSKVFVVGR